MTCERCEELAEKIAWLESELGLQKHSAMIEKIKVVIPRLGPRGHSCSRPQCAEFIAALYNAKGRPVSNYQLCELVPTHRTVDRNIAVTKVWVYGARRALGVHAVRTARGFGYQLTPEGMAQVAEILGEHVS